jgi:ribosomal-protein-alanine N-acetyltransferase
MPAIRRGGEHDLPSIARIQQASPEASDWRVEDYLAYRLWVAESGGDIAGFLVGRVLGEGECELLNLAVAPQWRRKGIGRGLIQAFLDESAGAVYLELRESNRAALNLYKSMGFQEVSRRSNYYNSPPEAAIVMKFHSC